MKLKEIMNGFVGSLAVTIDVDERSVSGEVKGKVLFSCSENQKNGGLTPDRR